MNKYTIEPVDIDMLPAIWNIFLPFLKMYEKWQDDTTTDNYLNWCVNGEAQLWAVFDKGIPCGAILTEERICKDSGQSGLVALALGGIGGCKWGGFAWDYFCDRARERGFNRFSFEGRKGWGRVLGKKPVAYRYEEVLNG